MSDRSRKGSPSKASSLGGWSTRSGEAKRLNLSISDSNFKSHISKVQSTYRRPFGPYSSPPKHMRRSLSIATENRSSIRNEYQHILRRREENWNSYAATTLSNSMSDMRSRPNSAPTRRLLTPQTASLKSGYEIAREVNSNSITTPQYRKDLRKQIQSMNLSTVDLNIFGLYDLNNEQKKIYSDFVDMLTQFDEFDRTNILRDAEYESNKDCELLQSYSGISSNSKKGR